MSGVDTQLIEQLLQEQNLDSEDVFCSEGGCFQIIDIWGGKIDNQAISGPRTLEFRLNNQDSPGNVTHLEIDNEVNFQGLLASKKVRGTRIMCVHSYPLVGHARTLRANLISIAL